MVTGYSILFFDSQFWTSLFILHDEGGYSMARHTFGPEPTPTEYLHFLAENSSKLVYRHITSIEAERLLQQVVKTKKLKKSQGKSTKKALDVYKDAMKSVKKERHHDMSRKKKIDDSVKYEMKRMKKKSKKRGH